VPKKAVDPKAAKPEKKVVNAFAALSTGDDDDDDE
jgi:hypothetical protein